MRPARALALTAAAAAAAVAALVAPAARARAPEAPVVLLVAGESLGHLEPCNCQDGMLGGFPRRLARIARERARAGDGAGALLVADGGDLTGGPDARPAALEAKARAALDLLAQAGAAAVAVGEQDLRLGPRALRRLADAAGVPLLCANAREPGRAAAPFLAWRRVSAGGRAVVLTAVLDPELGDPTGALEVGPPAEAVAAAAAEAAATTPGGPEGPRPLVIALFHGSRARAEALLAGAPVDVIVCGHDQTEPGPLARLGRAWLVETARDARRLTRVELPTDGPAALAQLPLDGHVPDDARARARVDAYYREVRGLPLPPRQPAPEGGGLVGAATCTACHLEAGRKFAASKHHGAYARVTAKEPERAGLFECVGCHVTGHGFEGGFTSLEATPHLAEVSCERCHGVGGNHVAQGGGRGYGVKPGFPESWRATCVACHDASNSPGFDFLRALEAIKHWPDR